MAGPQPNLLTYTVLVFLSGICLAWAVLSWTKIRDWTHFDSQRGFMINLLAGLILAALTGGFAFHTATSGNPTPQPSPTPIPSPTPPTTGPAPSTLPSTPASA